MIQIRQSQCKYVLGMMWLSVFTRWSLIQLAPKTCSEHLFVVNPALSTVVDGKLAVGLVVQNGRFMPPQSDE